ncbi:PilW family protein [Rhodoferax sediminis]|uniref:Prepilin-type N-terminal cleavage/methylation domain-containing protein n=1 Tax=Rhodoferax sediminis TaxID=2509614 RepID=A0A515DER6_9BURK|nr:PilW family protein [Rhodoferax sediminis]QDL38916.1 prepilin-type N-terminal cleavage/methylation domain-containing protein [Rhodoferax sediminis]
MSRTTASIRHTHRRISGRASRGFTLVELMVAITLGLFILIGLISLLVSNVVSRSELDKSSRQIESGRYAIQLLSEDLQNAGYVGASGSSTFAGVNPTACPAAIANLGYVPQTSPGTSTVPLPLYALTAVPTGCAGIINVQPNTAMLVVSRVNTNAVATTAKVSTETYLQVSSCATDTMPFAIGAGTATFPLTQKNCTTPEFLHKVVQHIYFVATCDVCSGAGTDTTPTLKMAEYVNGAMTITPLVEGIENLQFDYGVDMDGDGAPDCYISNPNAPSTTETAACPAATPAYDWTTSAANATTNWSNVMAVRVHVLARNTEASAGWVDAKKYDMGLAIGQVGPFSDTVKRHVYSAVVRLYNGSGQRE